MAAVYVFLTRQPQILFVIWFPNDFLYNEKLYFFFLISTNESNYLNARFIQRLHLD